MAVLTDAQAAANDGELFVVNENDVKLASVDELGTAWTWMLSLLWGTPDAVIISNQLMQKIIFLTLLTFGIIGNIFAGRALMRGGNSVLGFYF